MLRFLRIFLLLALLIGAAGAAWVAGTTEGARWLLGAVSRFTQVEITARTVEGRLLDRLGLGGLRIGMQGREVAIDRLDLAWQPLRFMLGRIHIDELVVRGVRIRDDTPRTPLSLAWPRLPGAAELFTGRLERLEVKDLAYRKLDDAPIVVDVLTAAATWQGAHLSIADLRAVTPYGRIDGRIDAGLSRPSLAADLTAFPNQTLAGMDRFVLQTRLRPGREPEQAAGRVTLTGGGKKTDAAPALELSAEAGVTRTAVLFRRLRLGGPALRGTITGEGRVDFTAVAPVLTLSLRVAGLDLSPQLGTATDLSGTLTFTGTVGQYRGRFSLGNKGAVWRGVRLAGAYAGNEEGVELNSLEGTLLAGTLRGNLIFDWREGLRVGGTLSGRNLDPARIAPDWKGVVNFDLRGEAVKTENTPTRGTVHATLLESRLHGRALTGAFRGSFTGERWYIERLALRGKGFDIRAAGELAERLSVAATVGDLSLLIPGTAGEVRAEGWVRRRTGRFSGELRGRGRTLKVEGIRIGSADITTRIGEGRDETLRIAATLRTIVAGRLHVDTANLEASGTVGRHTIDATLLAPGGVEARLGLAGGYGGGLWRGKILRFSGRDAIGPWNLAAPADLVAGTNRFLLGPLVMTGTPQERLEAAVDLYRPPLRGSARLRWSGLNLDRVNSWLHDAQVTGVGEGEITLAPAAGNRLVVAARANAAGTITAEGKRLTVRRAEAELQGNDNGLRAMLDIRLPEGGSLHGTFVSPSPAGFSLPDRGEFRAEWSELDLLLLRPWLPAGLDLTGRLAGRTTGRLLPARRFEMDGNADLSRGNITWRGTGSETTADLRTAAVTWGWRGETLSGTMNLALAEYGQASGTFRLPIPARFPVAADPQGPLQATLVGQVRERGALAVMFTGSLQESHGDCDIDLAVGGRWSDPQLRGRLRLAKAGAYLPTAGIRVKDVELTAHFDRDVIRIDSFRAVSGRGHLAGTAVFRLKGWHVTDYRGTVTGERFRAVYFPELDLEISPKLTFEGTPKKIAVRGELLLPEVHVTGAPVRGGIAPSSDVIVEGRTPPAPKQLPVDLDMRVRVVLGDRVFVKLAGIDAQLGGAVVLTASGSLERITSTGEIKVVKGHYRTYGVSLEIVRGRLFYTGGPIDRPALDVLALRRVGAVKAGVTVAGTLRSPLINLYSSPAMPDVDILAYIVLGRPLGNAGEQVDLLTMAAGALLSAGQSVVLQDKIKERLGLGTLEIHAGNQDVTGRNGYQVRPFPQTGAGSTTQANDVSQTMLTVGKYLTPKLYISYGRSLFSGSNLFLMRYDLHRHWQVETQTGTESGIDLYYKIEFK